MGNSASDNAAKDWFSKLGSDVSSTLGGILGQFTNIFKNLLGGAQGVSGLMSNPYLLIGGGCLALYLLTSYSPQGQSAQMMGQYFR